MGFLFKSTKKENTALVFDIESGSVGGCISRIPGGDSGTPAVLRSFREEIFSRDELDYDLYLEDMIKSLESVAKALHDSKPGRVSEISCVLGSPWYLSETRIIKITKEHSFVFTKKIAHDLLEKEVSSLSSEYKKRYGEIKTSPEVIEHNVMGVSLNGYPIKDPIGKRSRSLEINMITSLSPQICLDKIRQTLLKFFPHTKISFSSFATASYFVARNRYLNLNSYLLINVGSEITDVGIVTQGILRASLSFPFGKKTFFKQMCNKLNIEKREAKELFGLYYKGTLDSARKDKLIPVLKSIEDLWGEAFRKCINTLPHTFTLPETIFLTIDEDVKKWFSDVMCHQESVQAMLTGRKCRIVTVNSPEFSNICLFKDQNFDPFLVVETTALFRKIEKITW